MELELATVHQIIDEIANRGLQYIIAVQVINNAEPFKIHLCVDGDKDKKEVAQAVAPFFNRSKTQG